MDISDGLIGDLAKLTQASGVSAEVAIADIPFSAAAKQALSLDPSLLETVLTGGDDYEILFTCGQGFTPPPGISRIGQITAGSGGPLFKDASGGTCVFSSGSYRHF
jgi:thiamine-monophosphate kinase